MVELDGFKERLHSRVLPVHVEPGQLGDGFGHRRCASVARLRDHLGI